MVNGNALPNSHYQISWIIDFQATNLKGYTEQVKETVLGSTVKLVGLVSLFQQITIIFFQFFSRWPQCHLLFPISPYPLFFLEKQISLGCFFFSSYAENYDKTIEFIRHWFLYWQVSYYLIDFLSSVTDDAHIWLYKRWLFNHSIQHISINLYSPNSVIFSCDLEYSNGQFLFFCFPS